MKPFPARWLVLLLGSGLAVAEERFERYAGEALDLRDPVHLYQEEHWLQFERDELVERRVLYRCPSGQAFARKRVDYRDSDIAPAFELVDARFGYREGLARSGDGIEAFFRPTSAADERRSALGEGETLVADAGFDRFIQRNWKALGSGQSVALEFLVPSRGEALGFRVRQSERRVIDGVEARVVRLSLGGLLGLFAPNIDVAYAESDRRLLRFEGLSNIRLDPARNAAVRIDFSEASSRVAAEQWQAVLQQPLRECRLGT